MDALRDARLVDATLHDSALRIDNLRRASTDGYTGIDVEKLFDGAFEAVDTFRRLIAVLA